MGQWAWCNCSAILNASSISKQIPTIRKSFCKRRITLPTENVLHTIQGLIAVDDGQSLWTTSCDRRMDTSSTRQENWERSRPICLRSWSLLYERVSRDRFNSHNGCNQFLYSLCWVGALGWIQLCACYTYKDAPTEHEAGVAFVNFVWSSWDNNVGTVVVTCKSRFRRVDTMWSS